MWLEVTTENNKDKNCTALLYSLCIYIVVKLLSTLENEDSPMNKDGITLMWRSPTEIGTEQHRKMTSITSLCSLCNEEVHNDDRASNCDLCDTSEHQDCIKQADHLMRNYITALHFAIVKVLY